MPQPDPSIIKPFQEKLLRVQQVSFTAGEKKLVENLFFTIPAQKKVALIGLNGAGKSSLIRLLVGELRPQEGDIRFLDQSPADLYFKDKLGYQAAGMSAMVNLSSREYLQLCCQLKDSLKGRQTMHINRVVEQWQLNEIIDRPMHHLSQGNLQKLAIAQAFLGEPDFILLDEPTQALDPIEQQRFIDNLAKLENYQLCLFSSHHVSEAVSAADCVIMLHHGKLVGFMDLTVPDEYWLMTALEQETIDAQVQEGSVRLSYRQNNSAYPKNNLFCICGMSRESWRNLIQNLQKNDSALVELGNSADALMPLFTLLATGRL